MRSPSFRLLAPAISIIGLCILLLSVQTLWLRAVESSSVREDMRGYVALVRLEAAIDSLDRALEQAWFLGGGPGVVRAVEELAGEMVLVREAVEAGSLPLSEGRLLEIEAPLMRLRALLSEDGAHAASTPGLHELADDLAASVQAALRQAAERSPETGRVVEAVPVRVWAGLAGALTIALGLSVGWAAWALRFELRQRDLRFLRTDRARRRMRHEADHDPLTGLANRRRLRRGLARSIAEARRLETALAVHAIDLDNLKDINDRFGHAAGDQVLGRVAHAMQETLRENDLVARVGGDEFVVVQLGATPAAAEALARRLAAEIRRPVHVAEGTVVVPSASFGAASLGADGKTADELLATADRRLYAMKGEGRSSPQVLPAVVGLA